jgi:hypothetical protein
VPRSNSSNALRSSGALACDVVACIDDELETLTLHAFGLNEGKRAMFCTASENKIGCKDALLLLARLDADFVLSRAGRAAVVLHAGLLLIGA